MTNALTKGEAGVGEPRGHVPFLSSVQRHEFLNNLTFRVTSARDKNLALVST